MNETTQDPRIEMTVQGHAQIGQQIGQQIGTYIAKIVHHHTTYQDSGLSPEQSLDAACEYLAGGAASKAVELIEDALTRGFRSTKLAYYWQLALLAGRPFDHLSSIDLDRLERAQGLTQGITDNWATAVEVIKEFLECYSTQVQIGDDSYRFDRAYDRYLNLPEERRAELGRHLSLLFSGGMQNCMDLERRRQIKQHRMGRDRVHRVPMFFEPEPAEPRLRSAARPEVSLRHWCALVAGAALFVAGSTLLFFRAWETAPAKTAVLGAVLVLGCLGVGYLGPEFLHRRALSDRHRTRRFLAVSAHPEGPAGRTTEIDELILNRVGEIAPPAPEERNQFWTAVGPQLTALSEALQSQYPADEADPVPVSQLDWLVRWHADHALQAWASGDLRAPVSQQHPVRRWHGLLLVLSATIVVSAAGLLTIMIARWSLDAIAVMLGVPALLASGVRLLVESAPVYSERRRFREESAEFQRLFEEETAAWRNEQARLSDRPLDTEMAEWLDFDKDHIRLTAMKDWSLRNGSIHAHVVQTEPHPNSTSARDPRGPRRYSQYIVRLFLLTDNGVRTLDVDLDFATGAENKQQRHAFRYDAIASARIEERTVRRHGRRQVATPEGGGPKGTRRPIRRQSLHLTLLSGQRFDINADYDQLLADEDRHDNDKLLTLEMETSGSVTTLRTLESVAGEGREWINRERERNRSTASSYQRINDLAEPT
jgi:hypothetical protein